MEIEAARRVPLHEYDDQGKEIGPNPTYDQDIEDAKDHVVFMAQVDVEPRGGFPNSAKVMKMISPKASGAEAENLVIYELLRNLMKSIHQGIETNFQ